MGIEFPSHCIQDPIESAANPGPFPLGEKLLTNSGHVEVIRSGKYKGLHGMSPQKQPDI